MKLPLEAEKALIACLLMRNDTFNQAAGLSPEDFSTPNNAKVFGAIKSLLTDGKPADLPSTATELDARGELNDGLSITHLSHLTDGMPAVSSIGHYVELVKDASIKRRLHRTAGKFQALCSNGHSPQRLIETGQEWLRKLSAKYSEGVLAETKIPFLTAQEVSSSSFPELKPYAYPELIPGTIAELAGKIKQSGKTTFALAQCSAILGDTVFLGKPTRRTGIMYLTEQSRSTFSVALARAGLSKSEDFVSVHWPEIAGIPWGELVEAAVAECDKRKAGVLVVDTLGQFSALREDDENNAAAALESIKPLQLAANKGLAVLCIRHERKSGGAVGDSGRGSSAFGGAVDTLLTLRRPEGRSEANVRVLSGISRLDGIPDELYIRLDGSKYIPMGTSGDVALEQAKEAILKSAPNSEGDAIALADLCKAAEVKRSTGQTALDFHLNSSDMARKGSGKRGDPYLYWRPGMLSAKTSFLGVAERNEKYQ